MHPDEMIALRAADSETPQEPTRMTELRDSEACAAVVYALRQCGYISLGNIQCEVHDGVATLSGSVPSYYLKQVAQAAAARIEKVREVKNLLQVDWDSA